MQNMLLILLALCGLSLAAGEVDAAPASPAVKQVIERHKALTAAYNRGDVKVIRSFYAPDYQADLSDKKQTLDERMKGLADLFATGVRFQVKSELKDIAVQGETVTAVELADVAFKHADGRIEKRPTEKSRQVWKKHAGVWKLSRKSRVP